jgi:ubiquinone/menaquinone biosynthesis C-methylase UbiE
MTCRSSHAVCLRCRASLPDAPAEGRGEHLCACGRGVPYEQGIYRFVDTDTFYEGRFTATRTRTTLRRRFAYLLRLVSIDGGEDRMWRRCARRIRHDTGNRRIEILNIGAGGGHAFLADLGDVTAVDLSFASLVQSRSIYKRCYQADAADLPFADESFDLVFSSHLLGHIPLEQKQKVIEEIHRVTRAGGYSLHSAECEADNFVYRRARRYPDLYQKYFRDMYAHFGLEYPSACMARFRRLAFDPVFEFPDYCKGVVRPADSYKVWFGNEYAGREGLFRVLARLSALASFNRAAAILSGLLLFPLIPFNRLCGRDGVDSVKLLYRRQAEDRNPLRGTDQTEDSQ